MIYLFDKDKKLFGTVRKEHIKTFLYEREKNGLYTIRAELPVIAYDKDKRHNINSKAKDAVFLGHYDREDRFQLHKVVLYDVQDNSILIKGVHIFFDEAKAGATIKDRRYINREAHVGAQDAFETIGWNLADYDTSPPRTYNFYNISPLEARQTLIETFGFEFDFWLDFDGTNIRNKQFSVKRRLGGDSHKRYTYDKHTNTGDHVISLQMEQDHSEVYTAVIGRGRGEEIEETGGFGRRIEFTDEVWTKPSKPLNKPAGSRTLEDTDATAMFGYYDNGTVKPRIKVIEFPNIEDTAELLQASYEWLMENNVPKAVFSVNVADGDGLELGDSVWIIYNEIGLKNEVRVGKVTDDLLSGRRDVELGDVDFFKVDRTTANIKNNLRQQERDRNSLIYQLKLDFDRRFDEEVAQMFDDYEQALIDALAEIEARRERMETEWQQQWDEGMEAYERDKQAAYDEAERNYSRIENEVNDAIDRNRDEIETIISEGIESAEKYADDEIERKAQEIQSNLDTVTSSHRGMIDNLKDDVLDINDFIGPKDRSLTELLYNQRTELESKIETYSRNHPNLVVGSTLENINGFEPYLESEIELRTNESLNYIRTYPIRPGANSYYYPDTVFLEQGKTYTIGIDFRSDEVEDLDYIYLMGPYSNVQLTPIAQTRGLEADGTWHRYYFTFYWSDTTRQARLMIGTNFAQGSTQRGWFDTRQVHLYEGDVHNIPWTPSPSDNAQVVSQMLYEIRRLDDGMQTLASKTELDLLTGEFTQFTNEFTSTAESMASTIQQHDNWLNANGSTLEQTAAMVQSKVWMNDISAINANLIPFADTRDNANLSEWTYWSANARAISSRGYFVVRNTSASTSIGYRSGAFDVVEGRTYTLSFKAFINNNINGNFNYCYLFRDNGSNQFISSADFTRRFISDSEGYLFIRTFTANFTGSASVLIGTRVNDAAVGRDVNIEYTEPKLEVGDVYTPFMNAFSVVEQMANQIRMAVQGIDGRGFLTQSDIQIRSDYVQLGSQRLGDNQLASILRVSPNSIDAITDNLNLTGNLNVKGQIESLSLSVVEGNFARLFTSRLNANVIETRHISGLTAWFESMYILNANIERLVAQNVFTNAVTARSIQAIEGEFGRLFAAQINANVINTGHISGLTAEFERMYILNANIERLVAQNVFTREVRALSIEAVEADIGHVRSIILDSDVILSRHVNSSNAIIDKLFSENAYISRLTTKTQFVRDIQAIEITANQLNLNVLQNKLGSAEGGLYIYGPDGRVLINNSILRASFDVQIRPSYAHSDVSFTGLNYSTQSADWRQFEYFYTDWKGSQLLVSWATSLQSGGGASEYCKIRVRGFGGTNPIGTRESRRLVRPGETDFWNQTINLGVPNYATIQAYLEFCRDDSTGGSTSNRVLARVLRVSLIN